MYGALLVFHNDFHLDCVHDDPVLVAEAVVLGHDLGRDGTLGAADQLVGEGELLDRVNVGFNIVSILL